MGAAQGRQGRTVIGQPRETDRRDLVVPDQRTAETPEDEARDDDDGERYDEKDDDSLEHPAEAVAQHWEHGQGNAPLGMAEKPGGHPSSQDGRDATGDQEPDLASSCAFWIRSLASGTWAEKSL